MLSTNPAIVYRTGHSSTFRGRFVPVATPRHVWDERSLEIMGCSGQSTLYKVYFLCESLATVFFWNCQGIISDESTCKENVCNWHKKIFSLLNYTPAHCSSIVLTKVMELWILLVPQSTTLQMVPNMRKLLSTKGIYSSEDVKM